VLELGLILSSLATGRRETVTVANEATARKASPCPFAPFVSDGSASPSGSWPPAGLGRRRYAAGRKNGLIGL